MVGPAKQKGTCFVVHTEFVEAAAASEAVEATVVLLFLKTLLASEAAADGVLSCSNRS